MVPSAPISFREYLYRPCINIPFIPDRGFSVKKNLEKIGWGEV
jgi:hypothetical protein